MKSKLMLTIQKSWFVFNLYGGWEKMLWESRFVPKLQFFCLHKQVCLCLHQVLFLCRVSSFLFSAIRISSDRKSRKKSINHMKRVVFKHLKCCDGWKFFFLVLAFWTKSLKWVFLSSKMKTGPWIHSCYYTCWRKGKDFSLSGNTQEENCFEAWWKSHA